MFLPILGALLPNYILAHLWRSAELRTKTITKNKKSVHTCLFRSICVLNKLRTKTKNDNEKIRSYPFDSFHLRAVSLSKRSF